MSIVSDALKLLAAGGALVARFCGFKPGPPVKRLRGPAHIYPPRGSILEQFYGHDHCMYCPRVDPEQTPLTDPPCPRGRITPELA